MEVTLLEFLCFWICATLMVSVLLFGVLRLSLLRKIRKLNLYHSPQEIEKYQKEVYRKSAWMILFASLLAWPVWISFLVLDDKVMVLYGEYLISRFLHGF